MTTRRINDVFGGAETVSQLVSQGISEGDAIEVRAFAVFLRRRNDKAGVELADAFYACGQVSSKGYLEEVAPGELAA